MHKEGYIVKIEKIILSCGLKNINSKNSKLKDKNAISEFIKFLNMKVNSIYYVWFGVRVLISLRKALKFI
ncbi:hypothetical protein D3H41_19355 [Vibrio neocaledonicus]|nr:hypothetical protein D3H41_19355 [Vibrio neocaledonicus]